MALFLRLGAAILALAGVAGAGQAAQVQVHDPVMAKEGTTYYVYSTGPGITFYSSPDLRHWRPEGRIFAGQPDWAKRAAPTFDGHIWAPDVQYHDGHYLLYYSVSGFGRNASGIGVTVSQTLDPRAPGYGWHDQGMLLQSVPGRDLWNAIDPNVVADASGQGWLSFGSFWTGIKLVKLNAAWTGLAEPQEWHALARRARPAFTPDEAAGPAEIEAPYIFRRGADYFLFASFGLCCQKARSTYRLVVGRATDVRGPYLARDGSPMLEGGGTPLLAGDNDWRGLGHNGVTSADGKDYLVLHAYESADNFVQKLKILELHWDQDGWPTVDPADLNRYRSEQLPAAPAP